MKIKYIKRDKSVITGKKNLEHLYTFKDFPVFMGCVDEPDEKKDLRADMSFSICKDSGIIQLNKVLPLETVYIYGHNDGIGELWYAHYTSFSRFIKKFRVKNVLDIGGGNGIIAKLCTEDSDISWTIMEPKPFFKGSKKIKVIKKWFNYDFRPKENFETIVNSHVLEHIYDPDKFLKTIYKILKKGEKHIFAVPNLYRFLIKKYTNCLNFEHTIFLTEYFIDYLVKKNGFKILKKSYFLEHSIYYATEKTGIEQKNIKYESKYEDYKKIFNDYINYHNDLIKNLNSKISNFQGEVYLFGAHIFSQYLLELGLNRKKIISLLDNSKLKQNKRLYGTSLFVNSPEIIKSKKNVAVILRTGVFQDEIKKQLYGINKNVIIWE